MPGIATCWPASCHYRTTCTRSLPPPEGDAEAEAVSARDFLMSSAQSRLSSALQGSFGVCTGFFSSMLPYDHLE